MGFGIHTARFGISGLEFRVLGLMLWGLVFGVFVVFGVKGRQAWCHRGTMPGVRSRRPTPLECGCSLERGPPGEMMAGRCCECSLGFCQRAVSRHPATLPTPHSTLHTPHSTLHTPHSTLHTPHSTLHTPHSTLHTPHYTLRASLLLAFRWVLLYRGTSPMDSLTRLSCTYLPTRDPL